MEKQKHILRPVLDVKQTCENIKNLRKIHNFSVHEVHLLVVKHVDLGNLHNFHLNAFLR